jgi:hypothetical protein
MVMMIAITPSLNASSRPFPIYPPVKTENEDRGELSRVLRWFVTIYHSPFTIYQRYNRLRHPRLLGIRNDKHPREVMRE